MRNCAPAALPSKIVTSPVLTPEQKRHFLALEAENALPYPLLPEDARQALDEGVICDMFEGHAPLQTALRVARLRPISG
ncbi:putative PFL-like glycyl radical enzyme [Salmonella enterica subsp. enterica]|uniref:Putative PFL-like glycyl radical enzyme n=1 Tax=Salmonella enterica I TaxID=59201 RepID=A0A379X0U7_SALET|nr:putative PFL-like glycyl radical enzyme [Salmonella enterica subsp. enterica]